MTGINNSTTGAEAHLPFGGVKGSGNGTRESGIWVIEAYSYWHAVNDELSGKLYCLDGVDEIEIKAEVDWGSLAEDLMEITREALRLALYITDPWFLHRMCLVFHEWIAPMICGVEFQNLGGR